MSADPPRPGCSAPVALLGLSSLLLAGLASLACVSCASCGTHPPEVPVEYRAERYVVGVGEGPSRKAAVADARADIARFVETEVRSRTRIEDWGEIESGGTRLDDSSKVRFSYRMESETIAVAAGRIRGAEVVHESSCFWTDHQAVVVAIDRERVTPLLEAELDDARRRLEGLLRRAREAEERGDLAGAYRGHRDSIDVWVEYRGRREALVLLGRRGAAERWSLRHRGAASSPATPGERRRRLALGAVGLLRRGDREERCVGLEDAIVRCIQDRELRAVRVPVDTASLGFDRVVERPGDVAPSAHVLVAVRWLSVYRGRYDYFGTEHVRYRADAEVVILNARTGGVLKRLTVRTDDRSIAVGPDRREVQDAACYEALPAAIAEVGAALDALFSSTGGASS